MTAKLVKESPNGRTGPVEMAPRIASVPDQSIARSYVARKIGGIDDFVIFDLALNKGWNLLLEGDTGAGKTMAARAYAAHKGMFFYSTPNNVGIDPSQLFGKYIPDETGASIGKWQDGPVTDMVRYGGVLLMNEINFLPPRVATSLFSLLDGRREMVLLDHKGEVIRAHRPDCWCSLSDDECERHWLLIVGDMNPGYLGTQDLNQALRNRFELQVEWNYDSTVEKQLVKSSVLLDFANKMRKSRKDGDISTPTSTNMLVEFETLVFDMGPTIGLGFAMQNLVQHYDSEDRGAVQSALKTMESNLQDSYRKLTAQADDGSVDAPTRKTSTRTTQGKGNGWEFDDEINSWLGS